MPFRLAYLYVCRLSGYYSDPEARCQSFHICIANGFGAMVKHSFLCPNGTLFNQDYFICDWWFNVDCDEAARLAQERNRELTDARQRNSGGAFRFDTAASTRVASHQVRGRRHSTSSAVAKRFPDYERMSQEVQRTALNEAEKSP